MFKKGLIIIVSFLVLASCSTQQAKQEQHVFQAESIKVGDVILGWTVDSIDLNNNLGEYYGRISFSGSQTLTGKYEYIGSEHEFMSNTIMFYPDEDSDRLLPKMDHDERYTFFELLVTDETREQFGEPGSEGLITVKIKDYIIDYRPTETWNRATLVSIEN